MPTKGIKYLAASTEDIATDFENEAEREDRWAEAAASVRDKVAAQIRAGVWRQAAERLRQTEIRPAN